MVITFHYLCHESNGVFLLFSAYFDGIELTKGELSPLE